MRQIDKVKLHPVEKVVTTKVGKDKTPVTISRRYWEKPHENSKGLSKIGMSENEIAITNRLLEHTDNVYVVGGAVRDLIMGKKAHDFDLATDLKPSEIVGIFGEESAKLTGNVFPTVRVRLGEAELEVSTFRKEIAAGKAGDRNAFTVEYSSDIEDDLLRRDLTINALALHAKTGDVVDRFGGVDDIKNGIIRFVADPYERLREDPLRYLRAIRFKLRIDGEYSPDTKQALSSDDVKNLFFEHVSTDRIREEMLKGVQGIEKFSGFFQDLHEFGMLKDLFPEIHGLIDHDGGPWHGEDVFTHSMLVGDNYGLPNADDKRDVIGKLSAYLHDIGKPAAYDPQERTFYDHEHIGAQQIPDFLKRYRFSNEEISLVQSLVESHMRKPTSAKGVRKLLSELGDNVDYLLKIARADSVSNLRKTPEELKRSSDTLNDIASLLDQARNERQTFEKVNVNGTDIMKTFNLKPGPHMKQYLAYAKDLVLEDPVRNNNREVLLNAIREKFQL